MPTRNTTPPNRQARRHPDSPGALLVSDAEAARRLGLGKTKTRQLITNGELRSCRVGRRLLIPVAAIEEFVAKLQEAS